MVWLSPAGCGGFTGISREAEMCSGFPPPQAVLVTVASGEKGLWAVCVTVTRLGLRNKGGKSALTGFNYVL